MDTSIIRTLQSGPKSVHIEGFHCICSHTIDPSHYLTHAHFPPVESIPFLCLPLTIFLTPSFFHSVWSIRSTTVIHLICSSIERNCYCVECCLTEKQAVYTILHFTCTCTYLDAHNVGVKDIIFKEIEEGSVDNSAAEIKRK